MNIYAFFCIITVLFTLDSISKLWAIITFREGEYIVIEKLLALTYVQNPGVAFSLPITGLFLKILTVILIFGIWNAYERILNWYVTDFIALEHFAVFNLADSYISLGALWLIYYYFKYN